MLDKMKCWARRSAASLAVLASLSAATPCVALADGGDRGLRAVPVASAAVPPWIPAWLATAYGKSPQTLRDAEVFGLAWAHFHHWDFADALRFFEEGVKREGLRPRLGEMFEAAAYSAVKLEVYAKAGDYYRAAAAHERLDSPAFRRLSYLAEAYAKLQAADMQAKKDAIRISELLRELADLKAKHDEVSAANAEATEEQRALTRRVQQLEEENAALRVENAILRAQAAERASATVEVRPRDGREPPEETQPYD